MATFANIAINDGLAVSKTFVAKVNSNLVSTYELADASGISVAARRIKIKYTPAPKPDGISKTEIHVALPVVDAPAAAGSYTPAPREIARDEAKMLFFTSGRGTPASKKDLLAFARNLLSNTQVTECIELDSPVRG